MGMLEPFIRGTEVLGAWVWMERARDGYAPV